MQIMFVELFLNVGVKRWNLSTSSVLHSVHDKGGSPPWQNSSFFPGVYREFGATMMEIKVAETRKLTNFNAIEINASFKICVNKVPLKGI